MKKQGLLLGSAILVISAVLVKVLGAVFKIPLANMLGGTGMGYFSSAYGIFMPVYALTVTGIPAAISRYVAENEAFESYSNIRRIKSVSLKLFSFIGLIATLLILLLARPLCSSVIRSPDALYAVLVIALSVLLGCVMAVYRGYYEGLRNMVPTAVSQLAEGLIKLPVGLLACYAVLNLGSSNPTRFAELFCGGDVSRTEELVLPIAAAAAVMGITAASLGGMLFLMLYSRVKGDGITYEALRSDVVVQPTGEIVKCLASTLIPIAIGSLVTNLTSLIDLATIIRCLEAAVGKAPSYFVKLSGGNDISEIPNFIYGSFMGLAVTIFNLVPSFINMLGKGALPAVAQSCAEKDSDGTRRNIESVLFVTAAAALPCGLGITVLAEEILLLLFGGRPGEAAVSADSLAVLGIAVVFLSISTPVFSMLQGIGRADIPVKIMLAGVAVKLAGNLLLIPIVKINVSGAAIATLLCYIAIAILSLRSLRKHTGIAIGYAYIFAKPLYSGVLCAVTAFLTSSVLHRILSDSPAVCIAAIAAGGGVYLLSLYLLGGLSQLRDYLR